MVDLWLLFVAFFASLTPSQSHVVSLQSHKQVTDRLLDSLVSLPASSSLLHSLTPSQSSSGTCPVSPNEAVSQLTESGVG